MNEALASRHVSDQSLRASSLLPLLLLLLPVPLYVEYGNWVPVVVAVDDPPQASQCINMLFTAEQLNGLMGELMIDR